MFSRWIVLALVSTAIFVISLDMTVLHTALPSVVHDLAATNAQKLWIVNAYSLVVAGLLPGFGTLGDRVGQRRMFMSGLFLFGCASLVAAFAPNAAWLITARVLLAVGAAVMMPATLSLLRVTFQKDEERALAIGIWGAVASGGVALGPLVGGALLAHFWWGSVFLINVPVVLVALLLSRKYVPISPGNPDRHWDAWASVWVTLALLGLVYGLKEAIRPDGDIVQTIVALAAGLVAAWTFHRRQQKLPSPLIDFSLFRIPRFSAGIMAAMTASIVLAGGEFVIGQQLQLSRGYTPLEAGLFMLPLAIAALASGPTVGALLIRVGVERMLAILLALTCLGVVLFLLARHQPTAWQIGALLLVGFGGGGTAAASASAIMISAPEDRAGMAGSMQEVSFELGATLGVAILGSVMATVYSLTFSPPAGMHTPALAWDSIDQALIAAQTLPTDAAAPLIDSAKAAFNRGAVTSYSLAAALLGILALVMAVLARRASIRRAV